MAELLTLQQAFAANIRTQGEVAGPDGVDDRRMAIYRELFFNNIQGFLDTTFPVCAAIAGKAAWRQLALDFLREHVCHTPYFAEVCQEFLAYLQARSAEAGHDDPAWLYELAHYEWLELAVDIADVEVDDFSGQTLAAEALAGGYVRVNPSLQSGLYQYPVQQLSPDNPAPAPQLTALAVYRDAADRVQFLQLSPFSLALLMQCQQCGEGQQTAVWLADFLQAAGLAGESARAGALAVMQGWCQDGVLRVDEGFVQ